MLIGCITGPDLETAKSQVLAANEVCEGIELRIDLLRCSVEELTSLAKGVVLLTNNEEIRCQEFTISTYHNFIETPDDLEAVLDQMPEATIYKIATFANSTTDALRMLSFVQKHPNVAGMCMGELGQITRILAPVVGSRLNFASLGQPTAPGQMEAKELQETYYYRKLNRQTELYGLIGHPVAHSPSHKTHNAFFQRQGVNAVYVKMSVAENELEQVFSLAKKIGFKGLSVTMPFKEKISPYMDVLDEDAAKIGAVNTIAFSDCTKGYNTDGVGALNALGSVWNKRLVILGAGGSAKAIAFEAKKRGAFVFMHSRRYGNLNEIPDYDILVNTTPNPCPIELNQLRPGKVVMDITISHAHSPFLKQAKVLGCPIIEGEAMFHLQAKEQFSIWAFL